MSDDSMINTLSISATVAICQCARKWFYDIRGPDSEIDNKITQLSLSPLLISRPQAHPANTTSFQANMLNGNRKSEMIESSTFNFNSINDNMLGYIPYINHFSRSILHIQMP